MNRRRHPGAPIIAVEGIEVVCRCADGRGNQRIELWAPRDASNDWRWSGEFCGRLAPRSMPSGPIPEWAIANDRRLPSVLHDGDGAWPVWDGRCPKCLARAWPVSGDRLVEILDGCVATGTARLPLDAMARLARPNPPRR